MSRRRKKRRGSTKIEESWLLPYADLMTLLLALFIVLFSASAVDAQKFQQLSQVFSGIFLGGTGPMEFQQPVENDDHRSDQPLLPEETEEEVEQDEVDQPLEDEYVNSREYRELQELQAKINTYIQKNDLTNKFDTAFTTEGLLLTIRDNVLFDSGRADVRSEDRKTAQELAQLLEMDPPRNVIITGHTDNVPIHNSHFKSNWELSVTRAVNFMKILLENSNLDPRWFSAKGFGEYQPIGDNNTAEGREKNRRVEVLILPNLIDEGTED